MIHEEDYERVHLLDSIYLDEDQRTVQQIPLKTFGRRKKKNNFIQTTKLHGNKSLQSHPPTIPTNSLLSPGPQYRIPSVVPGQGHCYRRRSHLAKSQRILTNPQQKRFYSGVRHHHRTRERVPTELDYTNI
jgi:hypothetical protein